MIEIKNLYKKLDKQNVLEDINCTLENGNIYGLVGINGAGKSTLIRHMAGVYNCDKGEVLYNNEPVFENPNTKKDIVFLSDSPYFFHNYSINQTKDFLKIYYEFDDELFKELLKTFTLDLDKSINKFSKGMKKQSELLLGLCCNPKVLLLDETFDGLDPLVTQQIKMLLVQTVKERNIIILLSSHNLIGLDSICDYIYLLDNNKLSLQKDIHDTQSLFKIQLYFMEENNKEVVEILSKQLEILDVKEVGSILNLVIKGEKEDMTEKIKALNPRVFDILQFTFEEIFIYEVGGKLND